MLGFSTFMRIQRHAVILVAAAVFSGCPVVRAWAQTGTRLPARAASAQAADKARFADAVAAARKLLSEGRFEEAATAADSVLARDPVNHDAAEIKTAALLERGQFDKALAGYDAFIQAAKKGDPALLGLIARAELRRTARRQPVDAVWTAGALERLARAGDDEALQALKALAASWSPNSREGLALLVSLGRLGDANAAIRLGSLVDSAASWEEKTAVIRGLQDAGARSQAPRIAALLDSHEPQVQCAAALAIGVLQFRDAVPKLRTLFEGDVQIVRLYAAVALKRLGQSMADVFLAKALASEVPEIRLTVAEAYLSSRSTQWTARVRPLLDNRNEQLRLQAAELLAGADAAVARPALVAALSDPNPLMRAEAARILEEKNLLDLPLARRLLGDSYEAARLYGAGAAVRASAFSRARNRTF
jgi:HEAT repeat protein